MALQECGLNLDRALKELQPHGSVDFPCAGYASRHGARAEDAIPWHWHEELEVLFIAQGRMQLRTPACALTLGAGELAAINANALHCAEAAPECALRSLVFSPSLIGGRTDSAIERKYLRPLLSCAAFSARRLDAEARACFERAFDALAHERRGFEFTVRENLSRICLALYEAFPPQTDAPPPKQDGLRVRSMLEYIHEHFAERLTLAEISGAANVSERECLRCFQRTLGISPIQYLMRHRVMRGAELLRARPDDSVSEIALRCGFDSPSNFAKIFKRFYRRTPRAYRQAGEIMHL